MTDATNSTANSTAKPATPNQLGIVSPGITFGAYLANPGYGSSDLAAFKQGPPAMVPWRRANQGHSAATILGSAAHCRILEPGTFEREFYVKEPDEAFRTKEAKAKRDEMKVAGTQILSHTDGLIVEGIVAAFHGNPTASKSMAGAVNVEASMFWTCPVSGLPRRCRPDWHDKTAVYDLKVVREAMGSLERLKRAAYWNGWMHQLAGNRAGIRAATSIDVQVGRLVCIAPKPPHGIRVWLLEVGANDLDLLELENENICREMAPHHVSGDWPGAPHEWLPCPVPASTFYIDGAEEVDEADPEEEDSNDV